MDRDGDILSELTADHEQQTVTFSRILGLPSGDPERKVLVDEVTGDLVRHWVAEEHYLYPLVRTLPSGGPAADEQVADHQAAEALLVELEGRSALNPEFDRLVARLIEQVTGHNGREEAQLFPAVRAATALSELQHLGHRVRDLKEQTAGLPRTGALSVQSADPLPPPERGLVQRLREFFTPTGTRT